MLILKQLRLESINQVMGAGGKECKSSVEWKNPLQKTRPDAVIWMAIWQWLTHTLAIQEQEFPPEISPVSQHCSIEAEAAGEIPEGISFFLLWFFFSLFGLVCFVLFCLQVHKRIQQYFYIWYREITKGSGACSLLSNLFKTKLRKTDKGTTFLPNSIAGQWWCRLLCSPLSSHSSCWLTRLSSCGVHSTDSQAKPLILESSYEHAHQWWFAGETHLQLHSHADSVERQARVHFWAAALSPVSAPAQQWDHVRCCYLSWTCASTALAPGFHPLLSYLLSPPCCYAVK